MAYAMKYLVHVLLVWNNAKSIHSIKEQRRQRYSDLQTHIVQDTSHTFQMIAS